MSDKISLRQAFGEELALLGEKYSKLQVVAAGTSNSDGSQLFGKKFSDRFWNVGISEPNAVALATGMAMAGNPVVIADMAIFYTMAYAQLITAARQTRIHLIVAASHTGLGVGQDGGSAQDITDIGRMRLIPGFTIATPWDGDMVRETLREMLGNPGLYYLRLNRSDLPLFSKAYGASREPLCSQTIKLSGQLGVTVVTYGDMVYPVLQAVPEYSGESDPVYVDLFGLTTVEPLKTEEIFRSLAATGRLLVVENHMAAGGVGEMLVSLALQAGLEFQFRLAALPREFGTSGKSEELFKLYGLDQGSLARQILSFS